MSQLAPHKLAQQKDKDGTLKCGRLHDHSWLRSGAEIATPVYFYCVINAIGLQVVGASTDSMDIARGILRARR